MVNILKIILIGSTLLNDKFQGQFNINKNKVMSRTELANLP